MKRILFLLVCQLCVGFYVNAQDIHFSQFYETSVLRNPALTGVFSDDFKAGVVYRNQWNSLGNPYQTTAASAEARFPINREATDYLTVSGMFFSDKAGRAALKTTSFYASINYNKSLFDPHNSFLSAGFAAGFIQRSFDLSKLTFDHQYQGGVFVPSAGAGEALPVAKLQHWDLGAGVSFNSGIGENNDVIYIIGLSAYHLTQPRATFAEQGEVLNLATRWNASIAINATINDTWSLQAHGNYAMQGRHHETMAGGLLRWAVPDASSNTRRFAISAGAFYRLSDAIVPVLKLEHKRMTFGMSYDVNISQLKAATGMRGGLELNAFISGLFGGSFEDKRACPRF
jgi:type IX secretion system PorP/SprF family membrane protein